MKKILSTVLFMEILFVAAVAMAQDRVVVVPLGGGGAQSHVLISDYSMSGFSFTAGWSYFMSSATVTLPADGTCAVTATGYAYHLDPTDDARGPYIRIARQMGTGSPESPALGNSRLLWFGGISGTISESTNATATTSISIPANTDYKFGCAFFDVPDNWAGHSANCQVSWVCAVN